MRTVRMQVRSAGDVDIIDDSGAKSKKKTIRGVVLEGEIEAIRAVAGHVGDEIELVVDSNGPELGGVTSPEPPTGPMEPDHSQVTARFQRAITDGLRELARPLSYARVGKAGEMGLATLQEFVDGMFALAAAPHPSDGRVWDDTELRSLASQLDQIVLAIFQAREEDQDRISDLERIERERDDTISDLEIELDDLKKGED